MSLMGKEGKESSQDREEEEENGTMGEKRRQES